MGPIKKAQRTKRNRVFVKNSVSVARFLNMSERIKPVETGYLVRSIPASAKARDNVS